MSTLPDLTRRVDDFFTTTWYKIRADAIDNILDANVLTAAFRRKGVFQTEVGGDRLTATIRHGTKTGTNVAKGDVLSSGEDEIETMAWWDWKYSASHIQRSLMDDQKNRGPTRIKNLVNVKMGAAKDALDTLLETNLLRAIETSEGTDLRSTRNPDGIYNILPGTAYVGQSVGTYTYGNIDTNNSWWRAKYKTANDPIEINLVSDCKNLFNTCSNNQSPPDLLVSDQTSFEVYEEFGLDIAQLNANQDLIDLGFQTFKYKGADWIWTSSISTKQVLFLNTRFLMLKYDPTLWFDMTQWKPIPLQTERIAHILSAYNLICNQLRRQGWLGTYT